MGKTRSRGNYPYLCLSPCTVVNSRALHLLALRQHPRASHHSNKTTKQEKQNSSESVTSKEQKSRRGRFPPPHPHTHPSPSIQCCYLHSQTPKGQQQTRLSSLVAPLTGLKEFFFASGHTLESFHLSHVKTSSVYYTDIVMLLNLKKCVANYSHAAL